MYITAQIMRNMPYGTSDAWRPGDRESKVMHGTEDREMYIAARMMHGEPGI